jgi:hypothetical protein
LIEKEKEVEVYEIEFDRPKIRKIRADFDGLIKVTFNTPMIFDEDWVSNAQDYLYVIYKNGFYGTDSSYRN